MHQYPEVSDAELLALTFPAGYPGRKRDALTRAKAASEVRLATQTSSLMRIVPIFWGDITYNPLQGPAPMHGPAADWDAPTVPPVRSILSSIAPPDTTIYQLRPSPAPAARIFARSAVRSRLNPSESDYR